MKKKQSAMDRYVAADYGKHIERHICADVSPTGYIQIGNGRIAGVKMNHLPNLLRVGLLLVAGWLAGLVAGCSAPASPQFPEARGDECVEPLDVIRPAHMHFLAHQRDKTMHEGIRTKRYSLKNCIECHASKDDEGNWVSVNAPGQFCESCHSYAAVSLDCFQCHAAKPDK